MDRRNQGLLMHYASNAGLFRSLWIIAFLFLLPHLIIAQTEKPEPLTHIGLIPLQTEPLASQFAERLVARGTPVFYISNISKGISQGDIIRFRDKAVLIDGDVWQTMQNMGILRHLSDIPLITLNARAQSDVWNSRSTQLREGNEKKAYTLGRELLKIFEDYFGNTPSNMEMVIRFSGAHMTLVAPAQLMNELNFVKVQRVRKSDEGPVFINIGSPPRVFVSEPNSWTIWAVDPIEPSGQLLYSTNSEMPPGLVWNSSGHTISGTPSEAGQWPLSFSVRNSSGSSITKTCTLLVVQNTPPRLKVLVDEPVIAGTLWEYSPYIADAEHTLDELEVKLFNQPRGMVIDQSTKKISWDVPQSAADSSISFVLAVRDPLNATTREKVSFDIVSPENADQLVMIDLKLPLDTLIQGHLYRWSDNDLTNTEWKRRSVRLTEVHGDNKTEYLKVDSLDEGFLVVKPMNHGIHNLSFIFLDDTMKIEVSKSCVVLPNRPPVFRSTLTTDTYSRNQNAFYAPVITDEDGDSLSVKAFNEHGTEISLKDGALRLPTEHSGLHKYLFVATDPFGNSARQQIYYHVKKELESFTTWYLQTNFRRDCDFGLQSGGFRVGLYSTDIGKTLTSGVLGINNYQSPLFYVGANPLGDKQAALGNYLFLDCGISFRMYNEKVFGGGVMARVQSNYRHAGTSSWRFQNIFIIRLKQALLVTDTTGMEQQLRQYIEGWQTISESDFESYMESLSAVLNAYGQSDNLGIYLRLQTLYRLPFGFWLGPSLWIEDEFRSAAQPLDNDLESKSSFGNFFVQFTGMSLLHEWHYRYFGISQQLNLGWRGDRFAPKLLWSADVSIKKNR